MLVQFNEPILLGICHKDDKEYLDATKSFRIQLAKFLPILVFTKMLVHLISPNVWFVHGVICIFVKWECQIATIKYLIHYCQYFADSAISFFFLSIII